MIIRQPTSAILALGVMLIMSGHTGAQNVGNIDEGRKLAREVCAECHAVDASDYLSPNLNATPFQEVAETPGMTDLALTVWYRTPHPTMPNFILTDEENVDLNAYILSLKPE